eukprot:COSAG03_NODE_794_length_5827_cov_2.167947_4_plen_41_part_00
MRTAGSSCILTASTGGQLSNHVSNTGTVVLVQFSSRYSEY